MTTQAYPSYNDVEPSWAEIGVTAQVTGGALIDMADIASIKDSTKVEIGEKRGASGGRVMSHTRGSKTDEASMSLFSGGYHRFMRALMAIAPQRGNQRLVGLVKFDIMIQFTPPGSDEIFQTKLKGCRVAERSRDSAEGNDPNQMDITLKVLEIVDIIDGEEVILI